MTNLDETSIDIEKLGYRQGAIGMVIDNEDNFLIIQALDYKENQWRFPGGGVEDGEKPEEAIIRELEEELGSNKFEIISVSQYRNQYDWPMEVILERLRKKGKTWRGQQQWHFLVRFIGSKEEINPQEEELRQVKWVKKEDLPNHFVFEGQWDFVHKVLEELHP